jgi:NAD-dependent dihydropyrimidine dehydrogenase PreA subunit
MHHYHRLQEKINEHPIGAPRSDEFLEILKILFHPDEIEIAVLLDFKLRSVDEIAGQAGISREEALEKLETLANRGSILAKVVKGAPAYALLPNYPGLFEYPIMKGMDEATLNRLAQLWHAYYMQDMAAELAAAEPPWTRILPAENAIPGEIEILPFEVASRMMEKAEAIALANCPCRTIGKNCDNPLDVCLCFDGAARFLIERGMAKSISLEEARDVLKRSEEAGLVHTGSNNAANLLFLCNCCPCCCHMLMLIAKLGHTEALAKSSYRAHFDFGLCIGCGMCEDRCPMGAFRMDDDMAAYDMAKCIGCGLCVSKCPTEAIVLVKRDDYKPPAANVGELFQKNAARRQGK